MRLRLGLVALTAAVLVLPARSAAADGGAYIDFGGTFFTRGGGPSGTASGKAFVSVPHAEQDIFDRGPFHAYLLPYGRSIQEGRRLPESAIRVGTFAVDHVEGKVFVLRVSFAVPDVKSGMYGVHLCNEPCTVAGFREPLNGVITIAGTSAEAKFVQQLYEARWNIRWLQDRVERLKGLRQELEAELEGATFARAELERQLEELRSAESATVAPTSEKGRPLAEGWALVALGIAVVVALTSIVLAIVFARRRVPHAPFVVPDTIAELDKEREREDTLART